MSDVGFPFCPMCGSALHEEQEYLDDYKYAPPWHVSKYVRTVLKCRRCGYSEPFDDSKGGGG